MLYKDPDKREGGGSKLGESDVVMEAETEVVHPQAKELQHPLEGGDG